MMNNYLLFAMEVMVINKKDQKPGLCVFMHDSIAVKEERRKNGDLITKMKSIDGILW